MNKRYSINILLALFSFSAFAVKPNVQRAPVKRAPVAAHIKKEKEVEKKAQDNDANINEQIMNPTVEQSWNKFLRLKWRSLSRQDAWNLGTSTVIICGAIVYLYLRIPRNHRNGHAAQPPHDHDHGPDQARNNNNNVHQPQQEPANVNNPEPVVVHDVQEKTCDVCLDDKQGHEFHRLPCCGHNASCKDCLVEMINASLAEKTTANILCPNRNCTRPLDGRTIRAITHAHPEVYKKYEDVAKQEHLDKHGIHCPTPDCPHVFMNNGKIQQSMTCPQCKKQYCSKCNSQHSMKITCEKAKADLALANNKGAAAQADADWIKNNTKPCPQCGVPVQKNGGCLVLKCARCNHQFCWQCLKPHDHTLNHACGVWENEAQMNQAHNDLIAQFAGQGQQQPFNNQHNGMINNLDNIMNIMNNLIQGFNGPNNFNAAFNQPQNQAHNNHVPQGVNGQRGNIPGQQQQNNQPNVAQPAQRNANNNRPNVAQPAQNANNNRQNGVAANQVRNNANNRNNNANNANRNRQPVKRQGK